jgi:flavin-dependent dehydrogenase
MADRVLVIGGGPAGLAAAIAARLKGLDVTVADGAEPPIDKACGEAILPAGVAALRQLGVGLSEEDGFRFRGIRFVDRTLSVEATFEAGCGVTLRRTRLHEMLVARAEELGIRLLWHTPIADALPDGAFRWIVGADGQGSRIRHAAGLDPAVHESCRFGFRRHYRVVPWTDLVEVHWGPRCQIYVTPLQDEAGVALLSHDPHLRLEQALPGFPVLQRKLAHAEESSTERGAVTVSRRLRRVATGKTALIGDASGSVDAITGEGLSLSFLQAMALSEAFASGSLAAYQTAHTRLSRRPALAAEVLLALDRFSWLRRGVLKVLALDPAIFTRLLRHHALPAL